MKTAPTTPKLVAAIAALAVTFAIVDGIASLAYPAAQPAAMLLASNHVSR